MQKVLFFLLLAATLSMAQEEYDEYDEYDEYEVFDEYNEFGILILEAVKNGKAVEEPVFVDGDYVGYTPFRDVVPLYGEVRIGEYRKRVYATLKHNKTVKHTHIMFSNVGWRLGYMGNKGFASFEGGYTINSSSDLANFAMEGNFNYKKMTMPLMLRIMLFDGDIYVVGGAQFEVSYNWDVSLNALGGLGYFITSNLGIDFKYVFDPYKLKYNNFSLGLTYYPDY